MPDKVLLGASHYKLEAESSGNLFEKSRQMSFRFDDAKFQKEILHFSGIGQRVCFEVGGKEHVLGSLPNLI